MDICRLYGMVKLWDVWSKSFSCPMEAGFWALRHFDSLKPWPEIYMGAE